MIAIAERVKILEVPVDAVSKETLPDMVEALVRGNERQIGFGTPVQERFVIRNRERPTGTRVLWPVGALTSHIAGVHQRAPGLLRKVGLEWAWRLALEPRTCGVSTYLGIHFSLLGFFAKESVGGIDLRKDR